jgi:hypothetical protein
MPISSARGFIENEQDGLPLQEQHAVGLIIDSAVLTHRGEGTHPLRRN